MRVSRILFTPMLESGGVNHHLSSLKITLKLKRATKFALALRQVFSRFTL